MKTFSAIVLGMGFCLGAQAAETPDPVATLREINGKVMVNEGKQFEPGRMDQRLKPGDKVMVASDSSAVIVFDDECREEIEASKMITVPDRSTCAGGYLSEQGLNPGDTSAIGGGTTGPGALPLVVGAIITGVVLDQDDASP